MTGEQLGAVYDFEENIEVDDVVRVAWSDIFKSIVGRVVQVTDSHIDVLVNTDESRFLAGCNGRYGRFRLPKVKHHTVWSWHNRVEPENGYFFPMHPKYKDIPFSATEVGAKLVA